VAARARGLKDLAAVRRIRRLSDDRAARPARGQQQDDSHPSDGG
jgi:hypothetical protein